MKISVIVAIYNVEKYLNKCIDSILNQTFKNLEIILIDDGSTDSCPKICDEYLKKDSRIKVIHKKNGGLSDARNTGIKLATGDYIGFVDGDDYVKNSLYETLYNACVNNNCEIAVCGLIRKYSDREVFSQTNQEIIFDKNEAFENLILGNYFHDYAVDKLYKKDLFNGIEYPVGKIYEDVYTTYKLLYKANRVIYLDVPLYYYVQRNDSILRKWFDKKQFDQLDALNEIRKFIAANLCENLDKILEIRETNIKCRIIFDIVCNKIFNSVNDYDNRAKQLLSQIRRGWISKISNKHIHSLSRVVLCLSLFGYFFIYNLFKLKPIKNIIERRVHLK